MNRIDALKEFAGKVMCNWLHGGGYILRDARGRINWRCRKCGRWSDQPVTKVEERHSVDRALIEMTQSEEDTGHE